MPNKGQDQGGVLDRLRRRIDSYRTHHDEVIPRYENTLSSQNQQQKQETQQLKQRFLETNKAKKSAKKSDKKQQQHSDSGGSSIGPSKSNKRQNEDDQGGTEGYEPPSKIGVSARGTSSPLPSNPTNSSLYKTFSQNGKRGGSKAKGVDSQKYPASSSSHPKNGIGRVPPPPRPIPSNTTNYPKSATTQPPPPVVTELKRSNSNSDVGLPDFADLAQCAAALEKDAAKNGAITGSFLGENSTAEIFNSEVFNDLISDLSDLNPEVMSDYCLDDRHPYLADDLTNVSPLHNSNGTCDPSEPFHPVTPVTPTTSSPMRSTAVSHGHHSGMKLEGGGVDGTTMGVHGMERGLSHCTGPSPSPATTASPLASQLGSSSSHQPSPSQSYNNSHYVLDSGQTGSPHNPNVNSCSGGNAAVTKPSTRLPYSSPAGLSVDSPAAQTLKHMAEQHQHKAQMCITSNSATNGGVSYSQGQIPPPQQQQPQQSQSPSYMPGMNRLPGPSLPYSNQNPRFPGTNNNPQISVASPKGASHGNDRGSPATQLEPKPQHRLNAPNPNMQQQPQQFSDQQFHYGNGQNNNTNNMSADMGFNPNGHPQTPQMQPQPQQQQPPPSGQTINFTQQHLRMGGQPNMHVPRMPMPGMNRMGVPQRLPSGHMPDMQQQQQQQQQYRPMMDQNPHSQQQRIMRPSQGQHPRHPNMMPPHPQMPMGGMQPSQAQMNTGPGMGGQMVNRFQGMPGNTQMMGQQHQSYNNMGGNMGGNMPMPGPGNMAMRRPYCPQPNFQGMNPRTPGEQMLSSGSQNPHNSMGNPGMPHNEWMGGMNNDGSCPPYSSGPQRHPHPPPQQIRPTNKPPQQYHSGMPPNQAASVQGPPQHPGNFCQPHDHMGVPGQNHPQELQQASQQQIPPNFNQHGAGPNGMKMRLPGHHSQPQQQQSMYGNTNGGFGMKPPDNSMMCPPQNSMGHHPQLPPHQQHPQSQPQHNMYGMGNNDMMNSGGSQMNSNVIPVSGQQDVNFDLLVNGIRNEGDQVDTSTFNDADLLKSLDDVFQ